MAVLTEDDVIQRNAGSSIATTSHAVSLPSGTTAGNTVVVHLWAATSPTVPSGFVLDTGAPNDLLCYRKPPDAVTGGETSWTFTTGTNQDVPWAVWEVANMDPVDPMDVTTGATPITKANGQTLSTGTTARNQGLSVWAVATFAAYKSGAKSETVSWSGYTNGFIETLDATNDGAACGIAVAEKFQSGTTSTFESTATLARSGATFTCHARMITYRAVDAPVAQAVSMFAGFEGGTHGGITATTGVNSLMGSTTPVGGTWGTNYMFGSAYARNGGYGLRIVKTGGIGCVLVGIINKVAASAGFNVRVISGSGTPVIASLTYGQLLYDFTNNKFGVTIFGGTPSWQSGTTALNTWVWVEMRVRQDTATFSVEWRIETGTNTYTDQTSASLGGQTPDTIVSLTLGDTGSQTYTAEFDDPVVAPYWAAYPVGVHKVVLLKVDPAGTPSVSGTTSNFSVFTSNGTLAAWNATNARNAVDDAPPTISASADGVVQTAVAASDYMQFPMDTYTLASDEAIAGVRMLVPLWGGTGSGTGTLGIRGYDGTTETTLDVGTTSYDADSLTAVSTTYPRWSCAMWGQANGWTQVKLNAAALRVGFSTDATPDMGVHAIYLEVAIKKIPPIRTLTVGENDEFTVDLYINPDNSATISYLITNDDATRDVTFDYSLAGTPQTPVVVTPGNNSTVQINADAFGDVSDITLTPEA